MEVGEQIWAPSLLPLLEATTSLSFKAGRLTGELNSRYLLLLGQVNTLMAQSKPLAERALHKWKPLQKCHKALCNACLLASPVGRPTSSRWCWCMELHLPEEINPVLCGTGAEEGQVGGGMRQGKGGLTGKAWWFGPRRGSGLVAL